MERRLGLWLFIAFACVYLITNRGNMGWSNAEDRLLMAEHLLRGQRVPPAIEDTHTGKPKWLPWSLGHPLILAVTDLVARALVALGVPLNRGVLSSALACGVHALTAALVPLLVMLWARTTGYSLSVAVTAGVLIGISTPLWYYSQDCFFEIHQGLLLAAAFFTAYLALRRDPARWPLATGTCFGGAWLVKPFNVVLIPGLFAAWGVPLWQRLSSTPVNAPRGLLRQLVAMGLGFLPFWLAQVLFDHWRYGVWPVPAAMRYPSYHAPQLGDLLPGMVSLFVDPEKGLLWYSPAVVLSLLFAPRLVHRFGWYATGLLCSLAMYAGAVAVVGSHMGGQCWGYRYLVPAIPLCGLLFAEGVEWASRVGHKVRVVLVLLIATVVAMQVLGTVTSSRRWYIARDAHAEAGLPPPAPPLLRQPQYAVQVFSNYLAGRTFSMFEEGQTAEDLWREYAVINYPNYWWTLPVAVGASRWPFLIGVALLLVLAGFAFHRVCVLARVPNDFRPGAPGDTTG